MERPNLSVRGTSLVVSRWSLAQSTHLSFRAVRSRRRGRARNLLFFHFQISLLSMERNTQAGTCSRAFPFQWPLSKPGGTGVSTRTLGKVLRKLSPANSFHRRPSQGMPKGQGGRKLHIIIDAGEPVRDKASSRKGGSIYLGLLNSTALRTI